MGKLRFVRTLEQVKQVAEGSRNTLKSDITSVRAVYETDPQVYAALVPRPLEPIAAPRVSVVLSDIVMHISEDFSFRIGAGSFGVVASYDGVEGAFLLAMPMTTEAAVIGGRETYGEPKQIADMSLARDGERVTATSTRMGIPYLELSGTLGEELGAREYTDYAYCYKALPTIDKLGFEHDPRLVRLEWRHKDRLVRKVDGEVVLRESPFDPLIDVPVRKLVRMEYEEGTTESTGKVLRSVPGDWLLPFFHGRYDDTSGIGIELED